MTNMGKHLFMCLLTISLVKCLSNPSPVFLVVFFLNFKSSLYILDKIFLKYIIGRYFLPVCGLSFHFLKVSFEAQKFFNFYKIQFIKFFFFYKLCFGVTSKNSLPNLRS